MIVLYNIWDYHHPIWYDYTYIYRLIHVYILPNMFGTIIIQQENHWVLTADKLCNGNTRTHHVEHVQQVTLLYFGRTFGLQEIAFYHPVLNYRVDILHDDSRLSIPCTQSTAISTMCRVQPWTVKYHDVFSPCPIIGCGSELLVEIA